MIHVNQLAVIQVLREKKQTYNAEEDMRVRSEARQEAGIPVEVFVRGKMRAALLVDVSLGGAMLQVPPDMIVDNGEALLVRTEGLTSTVAHIRWFDGSHIGLEFRRPLHPSVLEFTLRQSVEGLPGANTARAA